MLATDITDLQALLLCVKDGYNLGFAKSLFFHSWFKLRVSSDLNWPTFGEAYTPHSTSLKSTARALSQ
jgi:hypothetical protein